MSRSKARFMTPVLKLRGVNAHSSALLPAQPTALSATAISATEIDLAWADNAVNETGYRVETSATGFSGWSTVTTLAADSNSYSVTGLTAGTEYFYRVFAFNGAGDSAASNVDSATTNTTWSYATLALAESSGDPWANADTIRITDPTPDVDFIYETVLDVNGHSGLRHADPFDDASSYSTSVLDGGEGPNTDPTTWTGWSSTGAWGTLGVSGGRSTFIANSGAEYRSYTFDAVDQPDRGVSFSIIRNLKFTQTGTFEPYVYGVSYSGIDDTTRVGVMGKSGSLLCLTPSGFNGATGLSIGTERDYYMYSRDGKTAFWEGTTLEHVNDNSSGGLTFAMLIASGRDNEIALSTVLNGHLI